MYSHQSRKNISKAGRKERINSHKSKVNRESFEFNKESKQENLYNFPEMESLENGIQKLVEELKENFDSHKYDLIISDDLSGRLLSLVVKKILDKVPGSAKKVPVSFILGGKYVGNHDEDGEAGSILKEALAEKVIDHKNLLIVTEYIKDATTIGRLITSLYRIEDENGLKFSIDVAALGVNEATVQFAERLVWPGKFFFGGYSEPRFLTEDSHKSVLGVTTDDQNFDITPIVDTNAESDEIQKIRGDVNLISEKIYKRVWEKEIK